MSLFARGKRSDCNIIMKEKLNKYFKQKFFAISKKRNENKENNIGTISRTLLSSLIIISIFFVTPIVVDFVKDNSIISADFENNSKNSLKKLLEKKIITPGEVINQKFLYDNILIFDEETTDSVRLSAATIEELFKSTNYTLKDVRKSKLVKPISLTLLPSEMKKIENSKKKKIFLFKYFYH